VSARKLLTVTRLEVTVVDHDNASRYAGYARLKFDSPHAKVLRITMDNGKLNTTDRLMHAELARVWSDIDADPDVNAAIITGAGGTFSAGGDFEMIKEIIGDFESRARAWREARDIVYNIINCSKPIVSAMRGVAIGAGLVCGILADISIASRDCRIIDGHTRLGAWPPPLDAPPSCGLGGRRRGSTVPIKWLARPAPGVILQ